MSEKTIIQGQHFEVETKTVQKFTPPVEGVIFSVGRNKTAGKEGQLRLGHSQGKTYGVTVHLMWLTKEILCFGSPLRVWSFIAI